MVREYIDIYFDPALTYAERIEKASFCIHFNRYWAAHIINTPGLTLGKHFITAQCQLHWEIGLFCTINTLGFWKDFKLSENPPRVDDQVLLMVRILGCIAKCLVSE